VALLTKTSYSNGVSFALSSLSVGLFILYSPIENHSLFPNLALKKLVADHTGYRKLVLSNTISNFFVCNFCDLRVNTDNSKELILMSYIAGLIDSNLKSLSDMLNSSLASGAITRDEIKTALEAEAAAVPAGGDIYSVTATSTEFLGRLSLTPDRDMLIIVKKILRSTKYAATTYYSVSGADNNPHHLPIQRFDATETVTARSSEASK
jgi:hypothetical protein